MKFDKSALPPNPKILLVRFRSIGDVTLNTAVFPLIKDNFPGCKLDYLVTSPNDELVWNNPHLNEIIPANFGGGNMVSGLWPTLRLIRRLRKTSYDMVIDMHGGPRSALITALSKAKYRVGLTRSRRARFYNVTVDPVFDRPALAIEFQARMLELLGLTVRRHAPKIHVTEEELRRIEQKLGEAGIDSAKAFGVIHPGIDSPHNEWQAEKFAEVADTLQTRHDLKILFACAPDQVRQVDEILNQMKTPRYSLAGQTTLREFAALAQKAEFLLCHNSGPMHIGAAVGTPVFALFGSSAPDTWIPQVTPHHVFYKNIECSPCNRATRKQECFQGNAECKRLITSAEVIQAIREKMNPHQHPHS